VRSRPREREPTASLPPPSLALGRPITRSGGRSLRRPPTISPAQAAESIESERKTDASAILRHHPDTTPVDAGGRPGVDSEHRSSVTTGTVDLLGILSASRALSSETSVERLRSRVIEILGAMIGATRGHLLVWSEDRQAWLAAAAAADSNGATLFIRDPNPHTVVPMTVLRYAQRVLNQAVLLRENRLIRSAFSAERLDAVKLSSSKHFRSSASLRTAYIRLNSPNRAYPPPICALGQRSRADVDIGEG
jgi:hypothetical protein